tara:strand:- start:691 stop:2448 length:1758 start_codon:yes stop_codon:yes gene_type:complete
MKIIKILILVLIFSSTSLLAQELDEKYLESLPEDMRKDILEQANDRDEQDKPVYRNDTSQLDKQEDEDEDQDYRDKIFGEDFFSTYQSTFMPVNEPNFDSEYILDYGDVLKIQLIGSKNSIESYEVLRNGVINIPDIGNISVAGLSLAQASSLIQAKVESLFIGTDAYTSIDNMRDINVLVSGNAFNPGIYTMSGNSNPLQALVIAGGINDFGSFRDIKVKRNNKIIQTIDVYEYLIFGNAKKHIRLQSGDLIFVEKRHNLVTVDGAVKRPMIYELKNNETLDKAIMFANGLDVDADLKNITLDRIVGGKVTRALVESIDELNNVSSIHKDVLNIRRFKFRNVSITGSVNNPGSYLMNEGETVYDLIIKAGGYSKNAYPFGGVFINQNAKEVNQLANDKLYRDLLTLIMNQSSASPETDLTPLISLASDLKDTDVSGRIQVELDLQKLKSNPSLNTILQDGDEIIIPELVNHIYIFGEISNQGTVLYDKDEDINYYINKQGGYLESADQDAIYVLLPNGESVRLENRKNLFMNYNDSDIMIHPGSVIFVPRKINSEYLRRQSIQAYAAILGNIGVSVASLAVLKD